MTSRKTIVITGAGRGIGQATAEILAARGHRLARADIDLKEVEAAAGRSGADAWQLDVSDREAFRTFLSEVEEKAGPVDVIINNAGICSATPDALAQDPVLMDRTIDVNLKGVMYGTLEALALMLPRRSGQVSNIASLAGLRGVPGLASYSASKRGEVGFTESVRIEYTGSGVNFTVVMPGPVATEMMDGTSNSPFVTMLKPEEMALAIADSVESKKERISLPRSSWALTRMTSLLPAWLSIRVNRLTRVDRIYTDVNPAVRSSYEERIRLGHQDD